MRSACIITFLVLALSFAAQAQPRVEFFACRTLFDSLHVDWRATTALYDAGLGTYEWNTIIRAVGPTLYFGTVMLITTPACRETPTWRALALGTFVVQTWAVNTHIRSPFGYFTGPPPTISFVLRW